MKHSCVEKSTHTFVMWNYCYNKKQFWNFNPTP